MGVISGAGAGVAFGAGSIRQISVSLLSRRCNRVIADCLCALFASSSNLNRVIRSAITDWCDLKFPAIKAPGTLRPLEGPHTTVTSIQVDGVTLSEIAQSSTFEPQISVDTCDILCASSMDPIKNREAGSKKVENILIRRTSDI